MEMVAWTYLVIDICTAICGVYGITELLPDITFNLPFNIFLVMVLVRLLGMIRRM